jgi:hypothetical protein
LSTCEPRHVPRERALEERELRAVTFFGDSERLVVRLLAVQLGIEIGAAGEDQTVDGVQGLFQSVRRRRHEQGATAGPFDCAYVVGRDQRRLEIPVAPLCRDDIGRDPDDRPGH